jgi:N-[(2S)-2-amino-2-carboxyethyl]-L-glutamate dehydrogenase
MKEQDLRILDRATVERCAASFNPMDVVESVLKNHANGSTVLPAEAYMEWTNKAEAHCRSVAMPGGIVVDGEPIFGVKIINAAVSNPAIGLDRAAGITMLFDPETARPRLMADGGYLSALRTAAYTLLSLRHLGPRKWESVSIIGCGTLAREHLRLLFQYYPGISGVYIYDTNPRRAEMLVAWAARQVPGSAVVSCATARQAVAASTVVMTLTTSRQPYIELGWFQSASFVAHVSLDDLTEEVFLNAEAVFVDDVSLVQDNPRRILGRLMAEGKLCEPAYSRETSACCREISGTLGGVLTERCEAVRPRDGVVVSNPFGMSILDIGLLERVARVANAVGLGRAVPVFEVRNDDT